MNSLLPAAVDDYPDLINALGPGAESGCIGVMPHINDIFII